MSLLAPQNLSVTYAAGDSSASLSWDAVVNAASYKIDAFDGSSTTTQYSAGTSIIFNGLTTTKLYTFTVRGVTAGGEEGAVAGPTVAPTLATPANVATTYAAGAASALVTFDAVNGASQYRVVSSPDSLSVVAARDGVSGGVTLSGLDIHKLYQFSVIALNANGYESAASGLTAAVVLPLPTGLSATYTPGDIQATIIFTAEAGAREYQVEAFVAGVSSGMIKKGTASGIVFSGLSTDASYQFKIKSINKNAMSEESGLFPDPALNPVVPGAPAITSVSYKPGDLKAKIYFTAPANHGGAALNDFIVAASHDSLTATGAASPIEITGLDTKKNYTFTVTAQNSAGNAVSAPSASLSVIAPSAPKLLAAYGPANASGDRALYKMGDTEAKITYEMPANYGGDVLTDFLITAEPALPAGVERVALNTIEQGFSIVKGLNASVSYVFMVQAQNSAGLSAKSNASAPMHVPVEVNLNVEINASGEIKILSEALRTPENVICATEKLSAKALYESAENCAMIEFWEDDNYDGLHARLAPAKYLKSAARLARGLQKVLCGKMVANKQNVPRMDGSTTNFVTSPFNAELYKVNGALVSSLQEFEHFGRVALACYAHYVLGHMQATAAITNDKEFMSAMLSLSGMDKLDHIDAVERLKQYNHAASIAAENVHNWTLAGSAANADLARRLVRALVDANYNPALQGDAALVVSDESQTASGLVIDLVKQVVGRDASRAMDEDNNKYGPENHGLLRFYAGDVVYVNIKLVTPDVITNAGITSGQRVTEGQLEALYNKQENYTIRIELDDAAALDAIPA